MNFNKPGWDSNFNISCQPGLEAYKVENYCSIGLKKAFTRRVSQKKLYIDILNKHWQQKQANAAGYLEFENFNLEIKQSKWFSHL